MDTIPRLGVKTAHLSPNCTEGEKKKTCLADKKRTPAQAAFICLKEEDPVSGKKGSLIPRKKPANREKGKLVLGVAACPGLFLRGTRSISSQDAAGRPKNALVIRPVSLKNIIDIGQEGGTFIGCRPSSVHRGFFNSKLHSLRKVATWGEGRPPPRL